MKILLLGGTGDARQLGSRLHDAGHDVVYSVAGLTPPPLMDCEVRRGGFGGLEGLYRYLLSRSVELMVDATHPYAAKISAHALAAASQAQIPLWQYQRPPWQPGPGDHWLPFVDMNALMGPVLQAYRRPFFAMGRQPQDYFAQIPLHQLWLVRSLSAMAAADRVVSINGKGPFEYENELALLREWQVDVLVCKNSGGDAARAKLDVARVLGIPVLMQSRPELADAGACRVVTAIDDIVAALPQS